jgi:hypothetical protein
VHPLSAFVPTPASSTVGLRPSFERSPSTPLSYTKAAEETAGMQSKVVSSAPARTLRDSDYPCWSSPDGGSVSCDQDEEWRILSGTVVRDAA